jgi:hypothetical protein
VEGAEVLGGLQIGDLFYTLSTVTDSRGSWSLPIIGTGRMELHVEAATHLRTEAKVELVEGRSSKDVVVKMERGATIRGTVFGADGRTPIAGARVHNKWLSDETTRESRTDAQGGFVVEGLARHPTVVTVTASGYLPQSWPVDVPGDVNPPAQRLVMTQRGGTIRGTVTDGKTGKPAAGLLVASCSSEDLKKPGGVRKNDSFPSALSPDQLLHAFGLSEAPHGETDADGRFELRNVPPGRQVALVLRRNLAPQISEALTVAEGQASDPVKIALSRKSPGFVAARLVKADGSPLVVTKVEYDERATLVDGGTQSSFGDLKTDDEGWLYLSVWEYKRCRLTLMVEGYGWAHDEFAPEAGQGYERQYVMKTERADAEIHGRVLKPNGEPAAGAVVVPFIKADCWPGFSVKGSINYGDARWLMGYDFLATTASDGAFAIRSLPPGRYGLMAFTEDPHKSGAPTPAGLADCLPVLVEPFAVGENTSIKDVTMRLGRAATLVVKTVSAKKGRPLAGLSVSAHATAEMKNMPLDFMMRYNSATTDAKGQARFERLAPGKYDVSVLPPSKESPPGAGCEFPDPLGGVDGQELKAGEKLEIKIECTPQPDMPNK